MSIHICICLFYLTDLVDENNDHFSQIFIDNEWMPDLEKYLFSILYKDPDRLDKMNSV